MSSSGERARDSFRRGSVELRRRSERARVQFVRSLGEPALFAITLSAVVSATFGRITGTPSTSREKPSRIGDVGSRSTGVTVAPSSQVPLSRKSFETCVLESDDTGFCGLTTIRKPSCAAAVAAISRMATAVSIAIGKEEQNLRHVMSKSPSAPTSKIGSSRAAFPRPSQLPVTQ